MNLKDLYRSIYRALTHQLYWKWVICIWRKWVKSLVSQLSLQTRKFINFLFLFYSSHCRHSIQYLQRKIQLSFSHCRLILSRTSWNLQKMTQKTTDGMRVGPTSSIGNVTRKKGWTMRPSQTKVKSKTLLLE